MKSRPKRYAVYFVIAAIVILMLIFGQQKGEEKEENEILEENPPLAEGSGFLEVESSPKDAEVFVDGISKGKSPIIIGNVAAGTHDVIVKKEGYGDFSKQVEVKPGKRAFLDAKLAAIIKEPVQSPIAEEPKLTDQEKGQIKEAPWEESSNSGKVNLGNAFLLYYDFSKKEFKSIRPEDYDIFSKRYNDHLTFTRNNPAQMKVIDKNIADMKKEDCEATSGSYGQLTSGQSICVITKEGLVAAMGGSWADNTENAELKWKVFG